MSTNKTNVEILDTTLRDGSQQEGLSLTVNDKLRVAQQLDLLGVTYIEGGWPGANPKDNEFFSRAKDELILKNSKLVAFGATRKAGGRAESDEIIKNLTDAGTQTVCIVAKSWDMHVEYALRTTLKEAAEMVKDSVSYLVSRGLTVLLDLEHFFDGYDANRDFAYSILEAGATSGAERLVLCDTNGGSLPDRIARIVSDVRKYFDNLGIHCHNDSGCAVANTLAAVDSGVIHVQGCINGYGERTGNADLSAVIPNLVLKKSIEVIDKERLKLITQVSHHIAELINVTPSPQQPYVGTAAFAHKAGLHTSAISRRSDAYEHITPDLVGNGTRFLVSEMSGRATLELRAKEFGIDLDSGLIARLSEELKRREYEGYHYEAADASFELLVLGISGWKQQYFEVESFRVISDARYEETPVGDTVQIPSLTTEATVKVHVGSERIVSTCEGNGPVNALDKALRSAIEPKYPRLKSIHLTDYRVRVLDTKKGTGAVTRVLIDTSDEDRTWTTIGVSDNIIEASWEALIDAIIYALLKSS